MQRTSFRLQDILSQASYEDRQTPGGDAEAVESGSDAAYDAGLQKVERD